MPNTPQIILLQQWTMMINNLDLTSTNLTLILIH